MKDFADIPNSSGSFPDVIAQDCSGAGETDGTAIIADTISDYFGFIQALLSEVGDTPSGSAELDTASQLLNAIKLLPVDYSAFFEAYSLDGNWVLSYFVWGSNVANADLYIPIKLPDIEIDVTVTLKIDPGAVETGADRMNAIFGYKEAGGTAQTIGSAVYDNGTASAQDLVITLSSYTPVMTRHYFVKLESANNTNYDYLYSWRVQKSIP